MGPDDSFNWALEYDSSIRINSNIPTDEIESRGRHIFESEIYDYTHEFLEDNQYINSYRYEFDWSRGVGEEELECNVKLILNESSQDLSDTDLENKINEIVRDFEDELNVISDYIRNVELVG